MKRPIRTKGQRARIAYEAARILAESGDDDYARARAKAAERVQCRDRHQLPDSDEIVAALEHYLSLYGQDDRGVLLARLRESALQAMEALKPFRPRLVGAVLDGSAGAQTPIRLHLFAEYPEQLIFDLQEKGVRWQEDDVVCRFADGAKRRYPRFRFIAGEHAIELLCLASDDSRSPPLSNVTRTPERGVSSAQLRELLATEGQKCAVDQNLCQ